MSTKVFFLNRTLADYGEEEFNYLQKFLLEEGVLHTQGATWGDFIDLKAGENGTPDMSVNIAIGNAVIETERSGVTFKVFIFNTAEKNLAISDNTSGADRVDAIVMKISRTTAPNALMNNVASLEVVEGNGATALTDGDIDTALGSDYDWIRLADITVADSETTILDADIADTRIRVKTTDSAQFSPTVVNFRTLASDPADPVEGDLWYNETDSKLRYYDGTAVINVEASSFTRGDGIDITSGTISVDLDSESGLEFTSSGKLKIKKQIEYGDGSDGDVVISSNTTLTSDMQYNNLTINSGITLNPNGYRIFVKNNLTNNGTIARNGSNGGNGEDGQEGSRSGYGASQTSGLQKGTIAGSAYGGAGGDGGADRSTGHPGEAGESVDFSISGLNGSAGGSGGKASYGGGSGGGGGDAPLENYIFLFKSRNEINIEYTLKGLSSIIINGVSSGEKLSHCGGSGGGGGGGTWDPSAGGGGAGGSGGGIIMISAKEIIINSGGVISAIGGNGGDGGDGVNSSSNSGGGGGGGGGNGGVVVLLYESITDDGNINLNGGSGGIGGAGASYGGDAGISGTAGTDGIYIKVKSS